LDVTPYSPVEVHDVPEKSAFSVFRYQRQATGKGQAASIAQLQVSLEYFFPFSPTSLSMLELCQQFLEILLMLAVKGDSPTPTPQSVRDNHCE
jgi:hypothetical protein